MEEKGVSIREDKAVAIYEIETRFAVAVRQRELLEDYIKKRLQSDKHFYTVGDDPGRKPSLTKEGAELICLPHNLKPRYAIISGPENPPLDDTPYQITVNCELMNGDKFGGQGIGSASSMTTKRNGERVQRQKDPGLRHNATIKMACKSAYIAATLNSTAASEFFTQDLEDDQTSDTVKQGTKEHWCSTHNIAFERHKNDKGEWYSHKTADGWCNEKDKLPDATKPPNESQTTAPEEKPATAATATNGSGEKTSTTVELDGIDVAWLGEALRGKLKKWQVGSYLHEHYPGVEGSKVTDILKNMSIDQRKEFGKEVEDRLKLV